MQLGHILFLGIGNMGGSILRGLLQSKVVEAQSIGILDPSDPVTQPFMDMGCQRMSSVREGFDWADLVMLCVKPQIFNQVKDSWRSDLMASGKRPLIISVMAGMTTQAIQEALSNALTLHVIRTMPNLPMTIAQGTVAIAVDQDTTADILAQVEAIFRPVASISQVQEHQMDAVTALSGSGPAFVFQFIEGMVQAGVKEGLSRQVAFELALSTIEGSTALVRQSQTSPSDLTAAVCSPGGTTIFGLHALEQGQFRSVIMDAVAAAARRSQELGS